MTMRGVRGWIGGCLLLLMLNAGARVAPELELAAMPEGRVLDEARLFANDPAALNALSAKLQDVSERTGYPVYLAVFGTLIGSEVEEQAVALRDAWLGEGPGMVVVLEADSGKYDFGWKAVREVEQESGERFPVMDRSEISPQGRIALRQAARALEPLEKSSPAAVERLAMAVIGGIEEAFRQEDPQDAAEKRLRFILLGVGLLAAVILVALLVVAWVRRSDAREAERLIFPKISVGMRLGAPGGGGKLSSRSFGVVSQRKS